MRAPAAGRGGTGSVSPSPERAAVPPDDKNTTTTTAPDTQTHAQTLLDQLWATRLARIDTQLERIANTAYRLGKQLADHTITRDDANRRLNALCRQLPVDDPHWVPAWLAHDTADEALHRGIVS